MQNKLYVGNLPYSATEEQLKDMFSEVGEVTEVKLITDFETGRSKGFAFVVMANDEAAQKAIEKFHGKDLDGRNMVVNVARPKKDDRGGFNRR